MKVWVLTLQRTRDEVLNEAYVFSTEEKALAYADKHSESVFVLESATIDELVEERDVCPICGTTHEAA